MVVDRLASWCYGLAIARRNTRFDSGHRVIDVGRPVVSVGNLTAGGTGKTPMTRWIVGVLQQAGHRPTIAMRGHGARAGERSDEAMEHERDLPGVPILAHPDRVAAIGAHLVDHSECDVIVLDDGFQHRFVARALDIVLIDGRDRLASARLLPGGRLREPLEQLQRADVVVLTHAGHATCEEHNSCIEEHHGAPALARCIHTWSGLDRFDADGCTSCDLVSLKGCRLVTRLGIANDASVTGKLEACGAEIAVRIPARDHQRFTDGEVRRLEEAAQGLDGVFVTSKDWVKLEPLVDWGRLGVPVYVPQLELEFTCGEDALRERVLEAVVPELA